MIKSRLRPNTFYQSRTKVLCVAWIRDSDLMTIFPAISGVESLAIYPTYSVFRNNSVTFDVAELNTVTLTGPRPTKLSCHWRWMQPPPESPGVNFFPLPLLFDNVTHLELDIKPELFDGKRLHCMQHLTHLSLVDGTGSTPAAIWFSTLIQRLHLADSIAVCIIYSHFPFKGETGDYLSSPEPRIVLATSAEQDLHDERLDHVLRRRIADQAHFMRQWGKRLDSQEMDMWEEAEQIVRAQRAEVSNFLVVGILVTRIHQAR
ncbi:hypothetical protein C8J56DRAFT_952576 [Mycena floridula]|nr:hypothetical protein C8J56DRAFT_952576 [Mycena floridula]